MAVTTAEIIEDIRRALLAAQPGDAAMTTGELAEAWGVSRETTIKRIKPLVKAGKLRAVRVPRTGIDARQQNVNAWELVG